MNEKFKGLLSNVVLHYNEAVPLWNILRQFEINKMSIVADEQPRIFDLMEDVY